MVVTVRDDEGGMSYGEETTTTGDELSTWVDSGTVTPADYSLFDPISPVIIASVICLITVLGNLAVLIPLCRTRYRSFLYTPTNVLIGNLALLDLGMGAFSTPPLIIQLYYIQINFYGCVAMYSVAIAVATAPVIFNAVIAIERYICIRHPFSKEKLLTDRNVILTLAVCWFIFVLIMIVPLMGWNQGQKDDYYCAFHKVIGLDYVNAVHFVTHFPSFIIVVFCYTTIYLTARRHHQQIHDVTPTSSDENQRFKTEVRLSWKCFIVVTVYIITRGPSVVYGLLDYYGGYHCLVCRMTFSWLIIVNALINPILYANSSKDLKVAIKDQFRCFLPTVLSTEVSSTTVSHET